MKGLSSEGQVLESSIPGFFLLPFSIPFSLSFFSSLFV